MCIRGLLTIAARFTGDTGWILSPFSVGLPAARAIRKSLFHIRKQARFIPYQSRQLLRPTILDLNHDL
jgi:hypothetical protein